MVNKGWNRENYSCRNKLLSICFTKVTGESGTENTHSKQIIKELVIKNVIDEKEAIGKVGIYTDGMDDVIIKKESISYTKTLDYSGRLPVKKKIKTHESIKSLEKRN